MIPPSGSEPPNLHAALGLDDGGRRLLWPGTIAKLRRWGYESLEPIAHGATSVVFSGVERGTGRPVVVKVCHQPDQGGALEFFRRERWLLATAPAAGNLLPRYYGGVDEAGLQWTEEERCQPFLLLEHFEGTRLGDFRLALEGGGTTGNVLAEKVRLCAELARAVQRLHDLNMVHGDLSTNNVLVETGGGVRLIDLGQGGTTTGGYQAGDADRNRAGTEGFSPAMLLARRELPSAGTDIRQAAAVMFHLLTGELAGSDSEEQGGARRLETLRRHAVPSEVAAVVQRGLRDRETSLTDATPHGRPYGTAAEMAKALDRYQISSRRRSQAWRVAVGGLLLLGVVLAGLSWGLTQWQVHQLARESEVVDALAIHAALLPQRDHPLFSSLQEHVRLLERSELGARQIGDWSKARQHVRARIDKLQQIKRRHSELSRLLPLSENLESILDNSTWIETAPVIRRSLAHLRDQAEQIRGLLARGELENAQAQLESFHAELATTVRMNAEARHAARLRGDLEAVWKSLRSPQIPETVLVTLQEQRLRAEREWGAGQWSEAERLYAELHTLLLSVLGAEDAVMEGASLQWVSIRESMPFVTGREPRLTDLDSPRARSTSGPSWQLGERASGTVIEPSAGDPGQSLSDGAHAGAPLLIDVQGVPFLFRWCPAGTFLMGSPPVEWKRDVDEDQVEVTLSRGFWLLETEVTQRMWEAIMGNDRPLHWIAEAGLGDEYPAYRVSGWDAQRFCEVLTTQLRQQRQLPSEWRASLPTEAEWEYACRAGSAGPYCFGDDAQGLQEFAWFSDNTQGMNRPVRTRQANGWGLSDMHGSVWEWTASRYEPRARGGVDPPVFPLSTDRGQHDGSWVLRGGSCVMGASGCRSAIRKAYERSSTDLQLGFRPCLRVGPPLPGAVGESASVAPDVNEQPAEPGRVEWPAGATDE